MKPARSTPRRVPSSGLRRIAPLLVAIAPAACPLAAAAQAGAAPTPAQIVDEGLRRQAERERAQRAAAEPHADALRPAPSASRVPELPDAETPCFVVDDITLAGPDARHYAWLQRRTEPFVGRCLGTESLSRIAAYLNAELIEQGYVTSRVSFGAQNLVSGRLVIQLHAGRVAQVRMHRAGSTPPQLDDNWGTWRNAFPTRDGARLNARDLEQGVEQMQRLPSQRVSVTLEPGADPDTSIVTLLRTSGGLRDRLRGGLTLDNSGSPSLGRTQASAHVAFDNPLGLNDLVSLSFNGNAERVSAAHRSQSASVSYSVPFGYSLFSISASTSRYAQIVPLTTTRVRSSGDAQSLEFKWQHVAWRTASTKTGVYASLATRRARSFLDDTELLVQRRRTTFFETGVNFKQLYAGHASFEFEAGYRRGMPWFDAQDDLAAHAQPGTPTLRPHLLTWSANLNLPFSLPVLGGARGDGDNGAAPRRAWQFSLGLHGQRTRDRTTSIDQLAIGSRGSVRGFDGDQVLLAENGWTLRSELATPLAFGGAEGSLYLGLDAGRVWGPSAAALPGRHLAGATVGVRGRVQALSFDVALATPLAKPEGFKTGRTNLYASLTWTF